MGKVYPALGALTGGGTGALDSIDGAGLVDGDAATVILDDGVYFYHLNATSSAVENEPFRVNPDTNAGTKSWHLVGTTARIGALVNITSDQTISTGSWTEIDWDAEEYDNGGFWVIGTPGRLTVPIGITKVKLRGNIAFETAVDTNNRITRILLNGAEDQGLPFVLLANKATFSINLSSAIIDVVATDYFELEVNQQSGGNLDLSGATRNWFSIEALGFA